MFRSITHHLEEWKKKASRKSLLIRGARQVGKSYSIREFGKQFNSFVSINLELNPEFKKVFTDNLDPKEMIQKIQLLSKQRIIPGETLLFIDEIQEMPRAITALRYFYEEMPELHVIAAGSLLEFAIENIGIPVGRVEFLHMYPLSFVEFLHACGESFLLEALANHDARNPLDEIAHKKALFLVGEYIAIGGMPKAVSTWIETKDYLRVHDLHHEIIIAYTQDFQKYAQKYQIKYVDLLFERAPLQIGKKFKYSQISDAYRKRELEPSLSLLEKADVFNKVTCTKARGIPLGSDADLDFFKVIFLDVALTQTLLGLELNEWIVDPLNAFTNKGALVEAFVGQELLAYGNPRHVEKLYYWHREERSSNAEVDYVIQQGQNIIPIEVKSGKGSSLKSLNIFLESHPSSPYGIRFSTHNYFQEEKLHSYPLYAIAQGIAIGASLDLGNK